jgi:hypothetical protein
LSRERASDLLFGYIAGVDEYSPKFASTSLLLLERSLQLLLRQQLLLEQDFA